MSQPDCTKGPRWWTRWRWRGSFYHDACPLCLSRRIPSVCFCVFVFCCCSCLAKGPAVALHHFEPPLFSRTGRVALRTNGHARTLANPPLALARGRAQPHAPRRACALRALFGVWRMRTAFVYHMVNFTRHIIGGKGTRASSTCRISTWFKGRMGRGQRQMGENQRTFHGVDDDQPDCKRGYKTLP